MVADKSTPLYQLELVLIELIIETCIDKSVFSGREIPSSYLEVFNAFRANGIQRIETSSWYRYPILCKIAPEFSGYDWICKTNTQARNTLNQIVSLHQSNKDRV